MAIFSKIKSKIVNYKNVFSEHLLSNINNNKASFLSRIISIFFYYLFKDRGSIGALSKNPTFIGEILSFIGSSNHINALGNPYSQDINRYDFIRKLEQEVIEWNKRILNCYDPMVEGYVTSGGTESNLFLMWSGREYLADQSKQNPIVISSDFTHYSISKAARILNLDHYQVNVNLNLGGYNINFLKKFLVGKIRDGQRSFMLPITIGYSSIGTSDDLTSILELVEVLKHKNKQVKFFIWVDAAAQGLLKSFLDKNYSPFSHELVQGYIVDFHKLGQAPLPSGVVLYKRSLRDYIEKKIDYLEEIDATISGSRPGSSILSIWGLINTKSDESWQKYFMKLERKKRLFIKKLLKIRPNAKVISEKNSLTIAIIINDDFSRFSPNIEGKFGLSVCNVSGVKHYKIHIIR
jgi:glutamate/tyrosine decarboxylase-like PLP-dependent enzyme